MSNYNDGKPDKDIAELLENHDLDEETAERVRDLMEELGVSEDDAIELNEAGI